MAMTRFAQKLLGISGPVVPEKMRKIAAECRAATERYRACAEELVMAGIWFDKGNFDEGYRYLVKAEEAFKGNF